MRRYRFRRRIGYRLAALRWRLGIETARDRERADRFDRALAALSETDRTIFLMARRDDLSVVEIARRLSLPIPEVQGRFAYALTQIARALPD
ncbi:RNA polymerase sigma factor [Sphingopyxis sp. DBS4]|uniref:RNA polymerase sigma factor n=1 Tax=Sphingopyxis sp. DBS4 TaxID=2968500 RepID=UPI00214C6511|nr:sigma factor-like helix-turn-helix DNA-binding protein [Sphingopyxis sp. DBS4]